MTEQNPFSTDHLGAEKPLRPMGLLEQFNLPPVAVDYIRKNQRAIWLVVSCIVSIVVVVSLYRSYVDYRENKAATAFSKALGSKNDGERRKALDALIQDYGSTSTSLWASMELVGIDLREKKSDDALNRLKSLNNGISDSDSMKPLVLYKLALVQEQSGKVEEAIANYKALAGYKQFEAEARKSLGGVYEVQGKKDEAMAEYEQYLLLTEPSGQDTMLAPSNRERDMVRSRLTALKK
ncbi:MAG: tetratricopeptide repeat protein [Desulfobulbaceae bacterium]|nr:tetratricopeptide repeat protein [Desulfobulbaceae bacterium]